VLPPLVTYIQRGLAHCYQEDQQSWSHIYHLDGRESPNESLPRQDVFYSLNVILGLASLGRDAWEGEYDLPALLQHNARRMLELPVSVYAYGMALWASAEFGVALESETFSRIRNFVTDREKWKNFRAQDAGIILIGMCEQKKAGYTGFDETIHDFFALVMNNFSCRSGLFFDQPYGFRRNFASFATQTYLTTACYHYGELFRNHRALDVADRAVRKLMSLQGPNGEWPWFYFVPKGIVADTYEVYSVHQDGMAALFLRFAERRGVAGARESLIKGFNWIFGQNQLGQSMMRPELGMIYRSVIRDGELCSKRKRVIRAILHALRTKNNGYAPVADLTLRRECRSYELGWVLYSFGTREDLKEILYHPEFEKNGQI
jgi:hypothetical protein